MIHIKYISVKHTVQLKVGVETRLSWRVIHGHEGGAVTDMVHHQPVLHLTEGDTVSIVCVADQGYPVMQFQWEHHVTPSDNSDTSNNTRTRVGREYKVINV